MKNEIHNLEVCNFLLNKIQSEFKDIYNEKLINEIYNSWGAYESVE